jgi:YidC/Oxa1 family membrane protein insertase
MLGLLLMGGIILGFMWLNQPEPKPNSQMPTEQTTTEQAEGVAANQLASPADTLTQAEAASLAAYVKQYGTLNSETGLYSYSAGNVSMKSNGTALEGVDLSDGATVAGLKSILRDLSQYRGFAKYLQGENKVVKLENEYLSLDLTSKGAQVAQATLKKYDSFRGGNVVVFSGDDSNYSFVLTSSDREFDTRDFYFTPVQENDSTVLMTMNLGGADFGIRYTLPHNSYVVKMDIVQHGMESIIPSSVATMDFMWHQKMSRQEAGRVFEERNSAIFYKYAGGDVENLKETSNDSKEVGEHIKWIGYKNQFFSTAFIARGSFNSAEFTSEVLSKSDENYLKDLNTVASLDYNATNPNPASFDLLITPNLYPLLSNLQTHIQPDNNLNLTRLIPLGWALFRWINTWVIIPVFEILGHWFSNYGVIILVLTLFIKLILFPFTYKSYMSQAKMRLLSPEITEINNKYPGQENAMLRQQKTMEIYQRAGANPMAGCLPLVLQMPVLIAIFTFFPSCIELRGQSFLWVKDLAAPDAIVSWSAHIPFITEYFGNHISLFCLLMTVTNIIYTKITMANQPSSSSMPGMKWMMYLMPVMFLVFFNNYAAGLSYYYFLSLLITIIQTYIFRRVVSEEKMRAKMKEAALKPKKKSGFMARLEEAQRQQQAMLREQQKAQNKKGNRR